MKTAPNNPTAASQRTQSWPPSTAAAVHAVVPNHWQSRAARGFTWNRDGASTRRRPH